METIIGKDRKWMTDKKTLAYMLVFLIGVSIMLYPSISNMWNRHVFKTQVSSYEDKVSSGAVDMDKELENAQLYNKNLSPKEVPDAFSVKDGSTDENYENVLNIGADGMMGYISIPSINVEIPIYHYTDEETLKKGAGHLLGSSLPVGGKGTHAVISAHRGLPSAKMFSDLNLLEEGDAFYIYVLDKKMKYKVDQIAVVEPDETESLAIEEGKDLVTLVTCTPYGVNTHRLLVRGHRVSNDTAVQETVKIDFTRIITTLLCILAGIALAYLIYKLFDRKRGEKWKLGKLLKKH
jgi:sortase A